MTDNTWLRDQRRWRWLGLLVLAGGLIWLLSPILTPFVLSALLAWLGNPLVMRLEKAGRSRNTAVIIVFVLMSLILTLILLLLIPLLEGQIRELILWLPRLAEWTTGTVIPWLETRFNISLKQYVDPMAIVDLIKGHWKQAGGVAATVLGGISKSGLAILGWVATISLIPVVTYYFLRDWQGMLERLQSLIPRPVEPTVMKLARESDAVLGNFMRGQISVMLVLGMIYALGLWLVGVEFGFLIGFIAGLVSFVPYLGAFVGISAALIAALVQGMDPMYLGLVVVVFMVGQTLESFFLTPWLVGDSIGLHPVAVIFSIMAGGQLFGFLGVLLALPVTAVVMVLLRYAHEQYTTSNLYGADKPVVVMPGTVIAGPNSNLENPNAGIDV
jgi:predicted PurR-regulated permease PerM